MTSNYAHIPNTNSILAEHYTVKIVTQDYIQLEEIQFSQKQIEEIENAGGTIYYSASEYSQFLDSLQNQN
jgi:hypothetical protein